MKRDGLSRLGAIAMVLAFAVLCVAMPGRYRAVPDWILFVDAAVLVAILLCVPFAPPGSTLRRIGRFTVLAAVIVALSFNVLNLALIVEDLMYEPKTLKPLPLFHTSVAIWFGNILVFAILYWLIDAGGPEARAEGQVEFSDFDFPARSEPSKAPPGWQPSILDYLFVAFTTNTSFGPTEAMPLTARAKALMILQSFISLVTIAGVAARAIGATG